MLVRLTKIFLVLGVAVFGWLGIFNFLNLSGTYSSVETVVSMRDVPGDRTFIRATTSPFIIWTGALFIASSKIISGALCSVGVYRMCRSLKGSVEDFAKAKEVAIAGCGVYFILLAVGFIFIGNSFYQGWLTEMGRMSTQLAFQYGGTVALIMLYLGQKAGE